MGKKNYAYINPKMLVWARLETPFETTEDVELNFPKIKSKDLKAWENGDTYPSITEAKKLSKIYKLPFAAFYLSEVPAKKVKKYTDRRTLKSYYSDNISYNLWSEIQRIESNRECMLDFLDEEIPEKIIPNSIESDISSIAISIREFLGLNTPLRSKSAYGNNPFNYYRNILERNGIIVSQISNVSLEEMKGLSIFYETYPIVGINNKDYDRSKVFSLFHELAHIFRRSSSLCTIDIEEHSDHEEYICDCIAAEVLMPKDDFKRIAKECYDRTGIINSDCISAIAGRFGVSTLSTLRRLLDVEVINKNLFFELFEDISAEYNATIAYLERSRIGKNIPVHYHIKYLNQNGFLIPRILLIAHGKGRITHGELCRILGVKSKHIASIEQAVLYK